MAARQVQPWMLKAKKGPKVPETPELRPDRVGSVKLKEVKGLTGAFTLLMAGADRQDQLTFHRPIGHTDLDPDEWVCSATADLPTLLAGAEDPREAQISRLEAQAFLDLAVAAGKLNRDDEGWHYYPLTGDCRETILTEADHEVKRRLAVLKAEHDAKQQGKEKAAQWHGQHSVTRNDVLEETYREFEDDLREFRKEVRAEIRERVPRTYRTLGGPLRDRPQVACPIVPKGASWVEAYTTVNKAVAYSLLQGDAKAVELTTLQRGNAVMSGKIRDMKTEVDGLKQERETLQATIARLQAEVAERRTGKAPGGGGTEAQAPKIPARPAGAKAPPKQPVPPPTKKVDGGRGPPPDVDTPAAAASSLAPQQEGEDEEDHDDIFGLANEDVTVEEAEVDSALSSLPPEQIAKAKEELKVAGKPTRSALTRILTAFKKA